MVKLRDGIDSKLAEVALTLPRRASEVVSESVKYAEEQTRKITPQSGISFKTRQQVYRTDHPNYSRRRYYLSSLRDSIEVVESRVQGEVKSRVQYNSMTGWRAHFTDSGTSTQRPQRFIIKIRERIVVYDTQLKTRMVEEVFS